MEIEPRLDHQLILVNEARPVLFSTRIQPRARSSPHSSLSDCRVRIHSYPKKSRESHYTT